MIMTLEARIEAFLALGRFLKDSKNQSEIELWVDLAYHQNNWFTPENTRSAIEAIANYLLDETAIRQWIGNYQIPSENPNPQRVGLIMAGNIPAVGFHDLFCVLISGNICVVKLSSQDTALMRGLISKLLEFAPALPIEFAEQMKNVDALIATGSDNTARYFEYYFRNKPHIIRKNRSSLGIIKGDETTEEFLALGKDITSYFGLGCRNVSKLYVPKGYEFISFYDAIEPLGDIFLNHKYKNNYDYNKSIYLINGVKHFDNGFLVATPSENLVSPISVIFYEEYENEQDLAEKLALHEEKIQCIVAKDGWYPNSVPFGDAQCPKLADYADGVDTMKFLLEM